MKTARNQMHLASVEFVTRDAIRFIREHEPEEGYFVAFSGGKDSIVTLELTRMAGVKHQAFYSCTGIDPPELVRFIREHYPDVKFLYPEMSFWAGIKKKSPPTRWARWCCDVLKKNHLKKVPLDHHLLGIRAEESPARKARDRTEFHKKLKKWNYKPIFHWRLWHVWDFIENNNLPYPSLYDEGYERIGCVICPFICSKTKVHIERNKARWPKMYRVFERVVEKWFAEQQSIGKYKDFNDYKEYLEAWYRGFQ